MPFVAKTFDPRTDYFTCTLGEAPELPPKNGDMQTMNGFIDHQAEAYSNEIAVGFPVPRDDELDWSYELFSFKDLKNGSLALAAEFRRAAPLNKMNLGLGHGVGWENVALICPSSCDFLFAWLGLMRAGYSVLLVAPQCQPAAIVHLCRSCHVSLIFHHESYTNLAMQAVAEPESTLRAIPLPWGTQTNALESIVKSPTVSTVVQPERHFDPPDTAFIFHTSGTSTGLPNPIIQTHRAAIGVIPVLDGRKSATFSTTPLYHGGIADCLRAWSSRVAVWLFPAATVPITSHNIHLCLSAAAKAASETTVARVQLFSSVPYVLQMLLEEPDGLEDLQEMELVGVGGAALTPQVGDSLVERGIKLVCRYGSAECGFLLSSHRDYLTDAEWQYLRVPLQSTCLHFEGCNDNSGLSELVVRKGWPHMAKVNREDGSFATGDLFEPHQTIEGAWKYHSRSDSQITLNTGKKFDPAPLEDLLSTSSSLVREVFIFGSGRQSPGILVFLSEKGLTKEYSELEVEIWNTMCALNSKGEDHTRISRDNVVIVSYQSSPLERSSKGTLLRKPIEEAYAREINSIYSRSPLPASETPQKITVVCCSKEIIRATIKDVLGAHTCLDDDADFFAHGIDSAISTQIRSQLQRKYVTGDQLPWNVLYDCGNIERLWRFISDWNVGKSKTTLNEETEMLQLVGEYCNFHDEDQEGNKRAVNAPYVVVLTGATGALGAHLLDLLRNNSLISQVICLVRAVDHFAARSRVSASLIKRRKPLLDVEDPKVWCSPCKLGGSNLGLSDIELSHIRQNATHIIHAAWAVNFTLPLRSFVDEHIHGLNNLLNITLSCSKAAQFTFCSTTASVLGSSRSSSIEETVSSNPLDAGRIGYSRSKWVAEAICAAASQKLSGMVNVLRIGQLTGDTRNGVWNISEAWPLMLSTVDELHCLPQLEEPLNWLPLDTAANAVLEISLQSTPSNHQAQVYHIVNNSSETTWSDLLSWSNEIRPTPFNTVTPKVWLSELAGVAKKHPAKNLLGLWTDAYGKERSQDSLDQQFTKPSFSTHKAQKESSAMRSVQPVDKLLVEKIWYWLDDEMRAAKTQVSVSNNRFSTV